MDGRDEIKRSARRGRTRSTGAMKSRRAFLWSAPALCLLLPACNEFSIRYRYRLTVEVDTPAGLRSGSSVIEVWEVHPRLHLPDAGAAVGGFRGEAVAVDLPEGQTLFALLNGAGRSGTTDAASLPIAAYMHAANKDASPPSTEGYRDLVRQTARMTGVIVLPRSMPLTDRPSQPLAAYPLLARFRNLRDPSTIEPVDPDRLDASFGEGMRLRRITVRITDDPVTYTIEKRLPWIAKLQGGMLDGSRITSSNELANNLSTNALVKR